jgi:hypothetical protein
MRLSICLLAALSLSAPAAAQFANGGRATPPSSLPAWFGSGTGRAAPDAGIGHDLHAVRREIRQARERGDLTRREARQLGRQADAIAELADRQGDNGLSASERAELEARTHYLKDAIDHPR